MKWGICMAINYFRKSLHLYSQSFLFKSIVLLLAALFFFTFSGVAQEDDSRNYFVHQDESDNFLIFQKLEWNTGSHIKWSEITGLIYKYLNACHNKNGGDFPAFR